MTCFINWNIKHKKLTLKAKGGWMIHDDDAERKDFPTLFKIVLATIKFSFISFMVIRIPTKWKDGKIGL